VGCCHRKSDLVEGGSEIKNALPKHNADLRRRQPDIAGAYKQDALFSVWLGHRFIKVRPNEVIGDLLESVDVFLSPVEL
jgi:hypothetical protein